MTYRAWLAGSATPGQRDALVRAFVERRVIEECKETIPGFLGGELLLSEDDPDALCVTVEWADRQSFLDWQNSSVRAAQTPAVAPFLSAMPSSQLFHCVHAVAGLAPPKGKP